VDLLITDPPYGIDGHLLHKHYNRNEGMVLDGYVEVPASEYERFSKDWIAEAARVLRPGGSMYIVSGYTNLAHILNALRATDLVEVNHLIWKYNFGVFTKKKYVSSHYHILFWRKPGKPVVFNTHARFSDSERALEGGSLNYRDREDVWVINREYKPGEVKNKNELPTELLVKMIQYSSRPGDLVCDFFLGGFSTAKVAIGLGRRAVGFEISKKAFDHHVKEMATLKPGYLLKGLRKPPKNLLTRGGKSVSKAEIQAVKKAYRVLAGKGATKKAALAKLSLKFKRGYWSLLRIVDGTTNKSR